MTRSRVVKARAVAVSSTERRRQQTRAGRRRLVALAVTALGALLVGIGVGAAREDSAEEVAVRFVNAWARGDYAGMYALVTPEARRRTSFRQFASAYRTAASTTTSQKLSAGKPTTPEAGIAVVPVQVRTAVFRSVDGRLRLPVVERDGTAAVDWKPHLVFPGVRAGERLRRQTWLAPRAAILARDGTVLASGPDRSSPLGSVASTVVGSIGPIPADRRADSARRGVPSTAIVGISGLEREFDAELAGRPGGQLLAGDRVIARAPAVAGPPVRSSIDPAVQRGAVDALAGRYGGAVALDPRNGEILGLAGIASGASQPPGSVFKIVTLAAALEHGVVGPSRRFPVTTHAVLDGVKLQNANGEYCGGSLQNSFAHSCNSVFAPLGAKLGAERLVAAAERFGFNSAPSLAGAARSTIPSPQEILGDLDVGSTAIGQGRVLATTLDMAAVSATIASRGVRRSPTARQGDRQRPVRVISPRAARVVSSAMRAVVTTGTGQAAGLPGLRVAGKTGTAELRTTVSQPSPDTLDGPEVNDLTDTDAWFVAFAPQRKPRVAVAVLLVAHGTGGETAAPAARVLLEAALSGPSRRNGA